MASEKGPSGSQLILFTLAAGRFLIYACGSFPTVPVGSGGPP